MTVIRFLHPHCCYQNFVVVIHDTPHFDLHTSFAIHMYTKHPCSHIYSKLLFSLSFPSNVQFHITIVFRCGENKLISFTQLSTAWPKEGQCVCKYLHLKIDGHLSNQWMPIMLLPSFIWLPAKCYVFACVLAEIMW